MPAQGQQGFYKRPLLWRKSGFEHGERGIFLFLLPRGEGQDEGEPNNQLFSRQTPHCPETQFQFPIPNSLSNLKSPIFNSQFPIPNSLVGNKNLRSCLLSRLVQSLPFYLGAELGITLV
jgi:hypothetical protein